QGGASGGNSRALRESADESQILPWFGLVFENIALTWGKCLEILPENLDSLPRAGRSGLAAGGTLGASPGQIARCSRARRPRPAPVSREGYCGRGQVKSSARPSRGSAARPRRTL